MDDDEFNERLDELTSESTETTDDGVDGKTDAQLCPLPDNAVATIVPRPRIHISRGEESEVQAYVESTHQNYGSDREHMQLGAFVRAPYPNTTDEFFAEVTGLTYEHASEVNLAYDRGTDRSNSERHRDSDYVQFVDLNPIATLEEDDAAQSGVGSRTVDTLPPAEMRVFECEDETLLRAGLGLPKEGPFAGHLKAGGQLRPRDDPLAYRLDNPTSANASPPLFRHILVCGSTGSGKTQFTKNFYRQLMDMDPYEVHTSGTSQSTPVKKHLGMLIIDPENEYDGLANNNPSLPADAKTAYQDDDIAVGGLNQTSDQTDVVAFIPRTQNCGHPDIATNVTEREFGIPFTVCDDSPLLGVTFEPEEPTKNAIFSVTNKFFTDNPDGTYEEFCQYLDENNATFAEEIDESIWQAVQRRMYSQQRLYNVFDQSQTMLTDITHEMFKPNRVSVIPTSHLGSEAEKIVVMSILSLIVENKLRDGNVDMNIKDTPLFVGIDEAHNYLQNTGTAQSEYIVRRFRAAAKQGRKYNLGLGIVTQNPLDVDDEIGQQANTKAYLTLEPSVLKRLEIPQGYQDEVQTFGTGDVLIKAPDVHAVQVESLRHPVVEHN